METKTIKQKVAPWLERYGAWKRDSMRHISTAGDDQQHHCHCCQAEYVGRFCPHCGQQASTKHITWKSVWQGAMDLWGVGSRSLPYTLWQLLWRPGYLIADYINGRRQESFPPIKMLVFVGVFFLLATNWTTTDEASTAVDYADNDAFQWFDRFIDWAALHFHWGALVFFSMLIVPTYYIFRFAPRCKGHTLPEGFFIQVFNSTQFLVLMMIVCVPLLLIDYSDDVFTIICFTVVGVMLVRTYRQLFGYRWWGTVWRLCAALAAALFTFFVIIQLYFCTYLVVTHNWERLWRNLLIRLPIYFAALVGIIAACYAIGKRKAASREPAGT